MSMARIKSQLVEPIRLNEYMCVHDCRNAAETDFSGYFYLFWNFSNTTHRTEGCWNTVLYYLAVLAFKPLLSFVRTIFGVDEQSRFEP